MQALISSHGAPEYRLLWVKLFFLGIVRLAVIDMEMHHPFREANRQSEANRCPHQHKNNNRPKSMNASVLRAASVQIRISPRKHLGCLQKKVGKKMLDLQQAEQKQD